MARILSFMLLIAIIQVSYGLVTRVKLTQNVALKAGVKTLVPFDKTVYDWEHSYHREDGTVEINHKAKFHIEAHASFPDLSKGSNVEVSISVMRDGKPIELTVCHTNDSEIWYNTCTLSVETRLYAKDRVFVGVLPNADTTLTSKDTYMFLSEKRVY